MKRVLIAVLIIAGCSRPNAEPTDEDTSPVEPGEVEPEEEEVDAGPTSTRRDAAPDAVDARLVPETFDFGDDDLSVTDAGAQTSVELPDSSAAPGQDASAPRGEATLTEAAGPFVTTGPRGSAEGPDCEVYRPKDLTGARHPVIVWGMGTGGFNTYQTSFDLWASYGFVVAAATLGNGQGDGQEMLACLDYVCGRYAPDIDCTSAGASGHSQGGAGAIMAGRDPRVITTAPIQPYTTGGLGGFANASIGQQRGPMLLLSGSLDTIATPALNQAPVFERINQPVVWATRNGADHVLTGIDGVASYRAVVLAWFRWQLLREESLGKVFYGPDCTLCQDDGWRVQRRGLGESP